MTGIVRSIDLPAGADEVWAALTEPGRLSSWFGADVELQPWPGGRATFRFADARVRRALVEEAEPPRRLAFRWLPDPFAGRQEPRTRVEYSLEAVGSVTRLTVVESVLWEARGDLVLRWPGGRPVPPPVPAGAVR